MEGIFEKEVSFNQKGFDGTNHTMDKVKKTARFKELDSQDVKQHRFHAYILTAFTRSAKDANPEDADEEKKVEVGLDGEMIYDMAVKGIKNLLVIDQEFTAQNKMELMQDSGALLSFGMWFVAEKVLPFFQSLKIE